MSLAQPRRHNLPFEVQYFHQKSSTMSDGYESVEEEVEDVEEESEEDAPKKKRREKKWKVRESVDCASLAEPEANTCNVKMK